MVWGVSNVWITYAMYLGHKTVPVRNDLDIFELSTRDSGKLLKIYMDELKEHFPKAFKENPLIGTYNSPHQENFEQYNLRYLRYIRIFSWNADLRASLWNTYKYYVLITHKRDKRLRNLSRDCNKAMRKNPDLVRLVFSRDIANTKVV